MRYTCIPLLVALACASAPPATKFPATEVAPAIAPRSPELRDPVWLPVQAREAMSERMQRHGADMVFLMGSVLLLDHGEAEHLAEKLAAEPRMGRPAPGERDTLNALMPGRFFELQDELSVRARAVADAARSNDDARLARAYGQLAETCVACHSTYLQDDLDLENNSEPGGLELLGAPTDE